MKGIVTVDDIVDVVQEEGSEDIQKIGGMEALDAPYLEISFWRMVQKRGAGSNPGLASDLENLWRTLPRHRQPAWTPPARQRPSSPP